jgi:two-component system OmpR family response regulator
MAQAGPLVAGRATWLVLADDGPAAALSEHVGAGQVQVVALPDAFSTLLLQAKPRIAIVSTPAARASELELLASERQRRSTLRAVFVNDPPDERDRLRALELGVDEALPLTISVLELAGRIRLLADRSRAHARSSVPVADDAELDLLAHELRRDGTTVHLRPKEFRLLALLAMHPGRAYSRRELIERVWGSGYDGDVRTIDVHVRWLRSKIEADPERPVHLVTVRGTGYRLDPPFR